MTRAPLICHLGLATVMLLAAACASSVPQTERPTPPPVPADWTVVESDAGDLRIWLPPWMGAFETVGTVFANEPPAFPGADFLELMAEGPSTVEPKLAPSERLEDCLRAKVPGEPPGPLPMRRIALPAGEAIKFDTVRDAGGAHARRYAAYAIVTPAGVSFLVIDGPPARWVGRERDVALIPELLEVPNAALSR